MKTPIISIVLPCYNSSKTIANTIEHILKQTFRQYELIIINDGSTDTTIQILRNYAESDERIRIICQENKGVSSARNYGLAKARGKWITFCDSDDTMSEDWLINFYNYINLNCDLISQGYISSKDFSRIVLPQKLYSRAEIPQWINDANKILLWGFLWCKAFKKEILDKHNIIFDENLTFQEDLEFILHYISHCESILNVNHSSYIYTAYPINNKYRNHHKFESSKLCIEHIKKICPSNNENINQILYFQRLMIEDIFISYHLQENDNYIKTKIKTMKKIFDNGISLTNCIGIKRKIFYFLYKYTPFYFFNIVMHIIHI